MGPRPRPTSTRQIHRRRLPLRAGSKPAAACYGGSRLRQSSALAVAVLAVSGILLDAQQAAPPPGARLAQEPRYTLRTYARNVLLDVVVTDDRGQVVNTLSKDDFEILEDGKPQRIVSFEAATAHGLPGSKVIHSTAELDRADPQAAVTILVLDEVNASFEDLAFARYSLRRYLDKEPARLAQPMMLLAVGLQRVDVLLDYTQDKNALLAAVEHHFVPFPRQGEEWNGERLRATFMALLQVAEATAGHPGHKNLVWLGKGLPTIDPMLVKAEKWNELQAAIRRCINQLRDARITLYAVDPAGIPKATDPEDESQNDLDPFGGNVQFASVARATGGRALFGRNDVDAELGSSLREGNTFYTIAYAPQPGDPGTPFRSINVRVRRAGLHALTRTGYYLTPGAPTGTGSAIAEEKRTEVDLLTAAATRLSYDGIALNVKRAVDDPYAIVVTIPSTSIVWQEPDGLGKQKAQVDVLIATFDRRDKQLSRVVQQITAAKPAQDEAGRSVSNIYLRLGLPRNGLATRLRVVVRAAGSGKVGASDLELQQQK